MPVKQLTDNDPDGTNYGQSPSDKISFYGATPAARRTGTFTTVTTTAATTTTPWGFSTSTQANDVITRLNEVVNTLVTAGIRGAT